MHKAEPTAIRDRRIRFGLVGCGRIAQKHIEAIQQHSDRAELAAICDSDPQALKAAQDKADAPGYSSMQDLIEQAEVDAVCLCTPSGLRSDQAVAAAGAGLHVITEKPMATRWADAKRMVRACDEAERYLFVVKQNRRNATLQLLKRAVSSRSASAASTWSISKSSGRAPRLTMPAPASAAPGSSTAVR